MISEAVPDIVLRGHAETVSCLSFREDYIFSCSNNSAILWDVKIQRECLSIDGIHSKSIVSCGILPSLEMGFSSGRDGFIKLWNFEVNREIDSFYSGCFHFCNAVLANEESVIFAACTEEEKVVLWDARARNTLGVLQSSPSKVKHGMITSLTANFTSFPHHIVSGYEDGSVLIGDLRMLEFTASVPQSESQPIISTAVSPKDATIAVGNSCELIELFATNETATENSENYQKRASFEVSAGTSGLSFRRDGRVLASSHWDGGINIFDVKKKRHLAHLSYHSAGLSGISFCESSNNKTSVSRFATAGKTSEIAIWNIF